MIAIPAPLSTVLHEVIEPGLALLPAKMDTPAARVMLLAIGLQESRFEARRQHGNGPARGFWQFEKMGGAYGVLTHPASKRMALAVCAARGVDPDVATVWAALEHDDLLACAIARLLLWCDPQPLPAVGEVNAAWDYYTRNWRPGRPHRRTWDRLYVEAMDTVTRVTP